MSAKRTDAERSERRRRRDEDEPQELESLAAEAAQDRTEVQGGLECPHCGCKHFEVLHTDRVYGAIRRRRACRRCGARATSYEKIPPEGAEKVLAGKKTATGRG